MTGSLIAAQSVLPLFVLAEIEAWAQAAVERVLNSLPEGLLIALFAWAILRVLPKQNSRTRFAVWFLALMAVVGIACVGGLPIPALKGQTLEYGVPAINLPAHWAFYFFLMWLAAASVSLARLGAGIWRLREIRKTCTRIDAAALDPLLRETLAELNAAKSFTFRPVALATSEHLRVPAALGLWEPLIVLPAWTLRELPASDLSIILRHEFAHLRRWDDWTNLAQKVVGALFLFHPAVWWIENRLSVEREMACDDVVVAQTGNAMEYASCLIFLLERSLAQRGWTMAQAIVHRAREASIRLAQILDKNRPASTGFSKPALGLVGAFAFLCLLMLPQTPQFVAFDRGPAPVSADYAYSATVARPALIRAAAATQSSLQPASVIPASIIPATLNIGGTKASSFRSTKKNGHAVSRKSNIQDPVNDRGQLADSNSAASQSFVEVGAIPDRNTRPVMRSLVFVEATRFTNAQSDDDDSGLTPAGTIWRVQVWQITFISPAWEQETRVPVPRKI